MLPIKGTILLRSLIELQRKGWGTPLWFGAHTLMVRGKPHPSMR
jgi:hypothetical protein